MPKNPHADYTPVLKGYSGQSPFKFWCQMALPLTYDDSLSYYELLNKVVSYLNNTISDVANVEDNVESLLTSFTQLQDYVNAYFDELDIEQELKNILDEMALDGSLDALLNPLVVSAVGDWLGDNLTPTTPPVDSTLSIEGAAADAKTTGDLIGDLNDDVDDILTQIITTIASKATEILGTSETHEDLNADKYRVPGNYYVTNSTNAQYVDNAPVTDRPYRILTIQTTGSTRVYQIALINTSDLNNSIAYRYYGLRGNSNAWTDTWEYLSNKTFVTSAIESAVSDIEDLIDDIKEQIITTIAENSTEIAGTSASHEDLNDAKYRVPGNYYVANSENAAYVDNAPVTDRPYRIVTIQSTSNVRVYQFALINTTDMNQSIAFRYYGYRTSLSGNGWADEWSYLTTKEYVDAIHTAIKESYISAKSTEAARISTGNLNTYTTPGTYKVDSSGDASNIENGPVTNTTYRLIVIQTSGANRVMQIALINSNNGSRRTATRYWNGSSWTTWEFLASIQTVENIINTNEESDPNVFELYTDFEAISGRWSVDGSLTSGQHSQLLKIRPDTDYYTAYLGNTACRGAFFDENGTWIAPLKGDLADVNDFTEISPSYNGGENTYAPDQGAVKVVENGNVVDDIDTTSGYYPASSYIKMYKFHSPSNAKYLSMNLALTTNANYYLCSICSKEIFAIANSGNYCIKKNDPLFQTFKNKKICVIGPSSVMINRLRVNASTGYTVVGEQTAGYIAGCQEYLKPYFDTVKGFGYSGAAYMTGMGTSTGKISIYTRICGGTESFVKSGVTRTYTVTNDLKPDLSGYDVFILLSGSNGFAGQSESIIGSADDNTPATYIGALKLICEEIRSQNNKALIFICTFQSPAFSVAANREIREKADEEVRKLGQKYSYPIIDYAFKSGYNTSNAAVYSYDGTHKNDEGNRRNGEFLRKNIIGF